MIGMSLGGPIGSEIIGKAAPQTSIEDFQKAKGLKFRMNMGSSGGGAKLGSQYP
jgi:hypothetical protein